MIDLGLSFCAFLAAPALQMGNSCLCLPSSVNALYQAEIACFVQRLWNEGLNKQNVLTLGGEYEDIYCIS